MEPAARKSRPFRPERSVGRVCRPAEEQRYDDRTGAERHGARAIEQAIAPNGAVTDCKLVSSSFNDAELERKVIQRVMLMNFGAKDVPPFTYPNYPIVFMPS